MNAYDPGVYTGVILSPQTGESAIKGTPYWSLSCRITGRYVTGGKAGPCPPAVRDVVYWLCPNAEGILADALEILGLTLDDLDPPSPTLYALSGRPVALRCSHEVDGQGRMRERWRLVRNTPASPSGNITAAIAALRARAGTPPPPPVGPAPLPAGGPGAAESPDPTTA
ncbi:MAG TPA: hypothetical protein VH092_13125 [Urbifossiella sp.]|jgi:hypothetical protein|nr:hypothetical protein [Urbifossiella sp.]